MTQYIPYSIRNNITDPDLSGLLDYLEREMGWVLKLDYYDQGMIWISSNYTAIEICGETGQVEIEQWVESIELDGGNITVLSTDIQIFYRTYRFILPAIRDLYSKK